MTNKQKLDILREQGVLNKDANKVTEPLFKENLFFDPNDLLQVKYEMLRQVTHEGKSISSTSRNFGFSRPSFYQAKTALSEEGLIGLVPEKTGPRRRHKLTPEVIEFINEQLTKEKPIKGQDLADAIKEKFKLQIHPRSIERVLHEKKTKK